MSRELAAHLRKELPGAKVLYQSELEEDPPAFGRALAGLWRYAPPADVNRLSARLLDERALESHIGSVMAEIRGSFDQEQSTMAAYDPLGFLQHPVIRSMLESGMSFQSDDGKSRILLIRTPAADDGLSSGCRVVGRNQAGDPELGRDERAWTVVRLDGRPGI